MWLIKELLSIGAPYGWYRLAEASTLIAARVAVVVPAFGGGSDADVDESALLKVQDCRTSRQVIHDVELGSTVQSVWRCRHASQGTGGRVGTRSAGVIPRRPIPSPDDDGVLVVTRGEGRQAMIVWLGRGHSFQMLDVVDKVDDG